MYSYFTWIIYVQSNNKEFAKEKFMSKNQNDPKDCQNVSTIIK